MRTVKGVAMTIAMVASVPALAENWVRYDADSTGSVYYVDIDSFRRASSIAKIWTKRDASKDKTVNYRESKTLWSINCAEDTISLLYTVQYDATGSVLRSYQTPSYQISSQPIVPGSIGESLTSETCKMSN